MIARGRAATFEFWVKTEDVIRFTNRMQRKKELQLERQRIKGPDDQQIAQAHKRLQLDHEFMSGGAMGSDIRSEAANMWRSTGGQAFQSRAADLPDIQALEAAAEAPEEEEEDAAEEEQPPDDGDGAERASGAAPGGKSKWFDFDKSVGKAQRTFQTSHEKLVKDMRECDTKAQAILTSFEAASFVTTEKCKSEERVLVSRKKYIAAILAGDNASLQQLISKFDSGPAAQALDSIQLTLFHRPASLFHIVIDSNMF